MFRLAFDVLCIYMNWDCISTELKGTSFCYIYRRGSWGQGAQSRSTSAQMYEIFKTYNDSIEHGLHAGTDHLVRNCDKFMKCVKNIIDMCQNMLQALKWVIMKKLSVPIKWKMRHLILWQLIVEKSHCFYTRWFVHLPTCRAIRWQMWRKGWVSHLQICSLYTNSWTNDCNNNWWISDHWCDCIMHCRSLDIWNWCHIEFGHHLKVSTWVMRGAALL